MLKSIAKSNLSTAFVINVLFLSVVLLFFTPGYETNDDTFMMMISGGINGNAPSETLVIFHYTISFLLKYLFSLPININWYTLLQYGVIFLSSIIFSYYLLKLIKKKTIGILAVALLLFAFYFRFYITPQYTSNVLILGIAAMVVFLDVILNKENSEKKKLLKSAFGIACIVLVSLIRDTTIKGLLMIAFPLFFYYFIKLRSWYIPVFFTLWLAIFFIVSTTQRSYYEDKHPECFTRFDAQQVLLNYPMNPDQDVLDKVKWSKNDYELMMCWFYVDPLKYNAESMKSLSEQIHSVRSPKETISKFFEGFWSSKRYTLIGLSILIYLLLRVPTKDKLEIAILLFSFLGVIGYLSTRMHLPHRVFVPFLFYAVMLGVVITLYKNNSWKLPDNKILKSAIIGAFTVAFSFQVYGNKILINITNTNRLSYNETIASLKNHDDKVFIVPNCAYPYLGIPIFTHPKNLELGNIVFTGWLIQLPPFNQMLAKYNIKNITKDLYERDDLYLTITCGYLIQHFIKENYNDDIKIVRFDEPGFSYFKLIKQDEPIPMQGVLAGTPDPPQNDHVETGKANVN